MPAGNPADRKRKRERARLGLLGRIAASLCLLDVFGHPLGAAELRACISKHFAHWEECVRKTRALNKRRREKGLRPVRLVEPLLWIIAGEFEALAPWRLAIAAAWGDADRDKEWVGSERSKVLGDIPADLLTLYDKLREDHNGVGAAALHQRRCEGCRMELTPTDIGRIRDAAPDTVLRCEECRRILVRTPESGL